jgi:hypothetical protein
MTPEMMAAMAQAAPSAAPTAPPVVPEDSNIEISEVD